MRIYTVHVRTPAERLDRDVVLIKEGFSWPAFLLSVFWALWMRLWLVALLFLCVELAWSVLAHWADLAAAAQALVSLGLAVGIGVVANDLRRWTLFRRGYAEVGVVAAASEDAAAQRFFDQHTQLAQGLLK